MILQKDGTVWTVGNNLSSQLGDGYTGGYVDVPVKVVNLANITAISIGNSYGLALKSDGTVWAWGHSTTGQLGTAVTGDSNVAVQVAGLPVIRSISAGNAHSLAIGVDGTVWAWGSNASGQLGSTAASSATPIHITGLSNIIAVAAGYSHSLALTAAGTVYAFGDNTYGELGRSGSGGPTPTLISGLSHVISISAYTQSLALCSSGTGYVWGEAGTINYGSAPYPMGLSHLKIICAAGTSSYAVDSSGNLFTGGITGSPVQVSGISGVTAVAGSGTHTLAFTQGLVESWGANSNGQLGIGAITVNNLSPYPFMTSLLGDTMGISQVATGLGVTYSLYRDGTVHAVGRNDVGQLGNGTTGASTSQDAPVNGLTNVVAITAGEKFAAALKKDGTVWTWGNNDYGQLGNGTTVDSDIPVQATGLTGVIAISAGNSHMLAWVFPTTIWSWGRNQHGQLGNGTTTQANSPAQMYSSNHIIVKAYGVFAGGDHSLSMGGASPAYIYSWGDNTYGQVGNGTTTDALWLAPVETALPTPVVAMAAGTTQSLMLDSSGNLYAWGDDEDGELGDGSSTMCRFADEMGRGRTPF